MNWRDVSSLSGEGNPSISGNLTVADSYSHDWLVVFQDLV